MCTKFTIERKRVITAPLTYVAYSTRIIIRINVHLEHIVECFSFFFAKKMYRFVEESERAKCEADDGENDGALICLFRFVFQPSEEDLFALSIARGKRCDAK